jgi:FtsP/CotA-like multicopper oxidase with cupredoxin domain
VSRNRHLSRTTPDPVEPEATPCPEAPADHGLMSRRALLRAGAAGAATLGFYGATSLMPSLSGRGFLSPDGVFGAASQALADSIYTEVLPTSPLIMSPFTDPLPIPKVLQPVSSLPGGPPGKSKQTNLPFANGSFQRHQLWPDEIPADKGGPLPQPILYHVPLQVARHQFTSSAVLPIDRNGQPAKAFDSGGRPVAVDPRTGVKLPPSTIYGFTGTFPGPAIHARYGEPVLVRFDNQLDVNPDPANLPRGDFGAPDQTFLTHLHNGHTAPESDGNPHYFFRAFDGTRDGRTGEPVTGYPPGTYCDNLYLNWPAGGDDAEKQSFFWFHDHRMDHTGANVYKGMVGLYPLYDPKDYSGNPDYPGVLPGGLDNGNEKEGLQLPGVPGTDEDGDPTILYDIPLAFFDCCLDDGVTVHHDIHDDEYVDVDHDDAPIPGNKAHPEWWGRSFYKHFPNHGFVGDLFTVNGKAYPVLKVKRRKYRFRFLDASVARIYEFKLMQSAQTGFTGVKPAKDLGYKDDALQGQFRLPDGRQCMEFLEIATDGGLLPEAINRNSFELWPAKRREVVIDFTKYQDGKLTQKDDVIFLTNVMKMSTGRMWNSSSRFSPDPDYKVPVLAFQIQDDPVDDHSVVAPKKRLRPLPKMRLTPSDTAAWNKAMRERLIFEVQRGSAGGETEWLINGEPFDPAKPLTSLKNPAGRTPQALQPRDSFALWEIRNGGGGWVHPFHLHMEEHRTVMRNGKLMIKPDGSPLPDAAHPDDGSREDLVALDPSESVIIYRSFRDFTGNYVAHCHNLAHEDHAMMFGWSIT